MSTVSINQATSPVPLTSDDAAVYTDKPTVRDYLAGIPPYLRDLARYVRDYADWTDDLVYTWAERRLETMFTRAGVAR